MKKVFNIKLINIIHVLLGLTIFCVPIVTVPGMYDSAYNSKIFTFLFLTEITTLLYVINLFLTGDYLPKKSHLLSSVAIFIFINLLSTFSGIDPVFSFWSGVFRMDGVLILLHFFAFFIILVSVAKNTRLFRWLMSLSVLSSTIVILSVYLGNQGIDNLSDLLGNRLGYLSFASGIIPNDSFAASYVVFNLFYAFYLYLTEQKKILKIFFLVSIFITFFSPLFLNFGLFSGDFTLDSFLRDKLSILGSSRGVILGTLLGLLISTLAYLSVQGSKRVRSFTKLGLIGTSLTIVCFLSLAFVPYTKFNDVFNKLTGGYRSIYIEQAVSGFKERPLLGWGAGNFHAVNFKYFDPKIFVNYSGRIETDSDKVHNVIFDRLIESGILGLVSYLLIFFMAFRSLWNSDKLLVDAKAIFSGLLVAFFIQNIFFFDNGLSNLMFFFTLAFIIINERVNVSNIFVDSTKENLWHMRLELACLFVVFALLVFFIVFRNCVYLPLKEAVWSYHYYSLLPETRQYVDNPNFDYSLYGKGDEIYYIDRLARAGYGKNLAKGKAQIENREFYFNDIQQMINRLEKLDLPNNNLQRLYLLFNLHLMNYSLGYKVDENLKDMQVIASQCIMLSPKNPVPYFSYGLSLYHQGKKKEALEWFNKAILLNPNIVELHKTAIQTAKETNNQSLIKTQEKFAKMSLKDNFSEVKK